MSDNENDNDNESSFESSQPARVQRSTSHNGVRIETDTKDTPKKKDSNEPKIIVTAFAPNPKAKQEPQSVAVRPAGYLFNARGNNADKQQVVEIEDEFTSSRKLNLIYTDGKNNPPIILFHPKVLRKTFWECKKIGEQYRLTYKFANGEKKLIKALLDGHGFREAHPNSSEFNLIWASSNLKTYAFRSLQPNQKVNHFPRSCEITRKDRLYKNVQRMGKEKGVRAFSFLPQTFVMPFEIDEFYNTFYKERGLWIVKPASLSCGRGIYLINHPDQIPLEDNLIVCKYISNPLLIEGFKFDLRLYVAVTSFDPLVVYMYEEGLTRFATVKYDQGLKNIKNICMHLTNYSLNKKNERYVHCNDPDVEDFGNKWSLGALLRFLNSQGRDTFTMMMYIEEIIIKTLLSVESQLASASRMFVPNRGNCFELFGFDILIDSDLKPWVIEVNMSPSLNCDALIDLKIKSQVVSDLFTLTGIACQNPSAFNNKSRYQKEHNTHRSVKTNDIKSRIRPHSAHSTSSSNLRGFVNDSSLYENMSPIEQDILKTVIDESERSNNWVRMFPSADTWEFYSQYLENRSTSYNMMLHKKLYPKRWQSGHVKKATQSRPKVLATLLQSHKDNMDAYNSSETTGASLLEAIDRYRRYERRLKDTLHPTDETLRRFTQNFDIHQTLNQHMSQQKLNSFPHGELSSSMTKKTSASNQQHSKSRQQQVPSRVTNNNVSSSDISSGEDNNNDQQQRTKSSLTNSKTTGNQQSNRQLPTIANGTNSNTSSQKQLASIQNHTKRIKSSKKQPRDASKAPKNPSSRQSKSKYDSDNNNFDSDTSYSGADEDNDLINENVETKYDLETVLEYLDKGYYISRIQIRNAFALYLFKIHVRLVAESQFKDDSNIQQMDLVLRFIKKAAPNLSQEFKVFVPSKKLPLCEQKRMLAKELHDFLHIYRKDSGQIRIDCGAQLEQEKRSKKNRNKLIDEKAFQALLYRCCEAELEEIMSVYMKNSHDSSVFLGVSKSGADGSKINDSNDPNCFNLTTSSINSEVNGAQEVSRPTTRLKSSKSTKDSSSEQAKVLINSLTAAHEMTAAKKRVKSGLKQEANRSELQSRLKSSKSLGRLKAGSEEPLKPKEVKKETKKSGKGSNSAEDELSCDSFITNSSDDEEEAVADEDKGEYAGSIFYSGSMSRGSSVHSASNARKLAHRSKSQDKHMKNLAGSLKLHREYANQADVIDLNADKEKVDNMKTRKTLVKSATLNKTAAATAVTVTTGANAPTQESIMAQIYTQPQSTGTITTTTKSNSKAKLTSTLIPANNKKTPLAMTLGASTGFNDKPSTACEPINQPIQSKKLHQQLVSISSGNYTQSVQANSKANDTSLTMTTSPNSNKFHINSVFIHRHISNNGKNNINHFETTSPSSKNPSNNDSFYQKTSLFKDQNAEEYAAISRELKSLNLRQHERIYSAAKSSFRLASSLNSDDLQDTNRRMLTLDELGGSKNNSLIDHLERQKEKTSLLLKKSKAKHNEMISMSLIRN